MLSECTPEDIKNQTGRAQIAEYFHGLGVKNVGVGYVEAEKNCTVLDTSGAGSATCHLSCFQRSNCNSRNLFDEG